MPNLLLTFPNLSEHEFAPWVDVSAARRSGLAPEQAAAAMAHDWERKLADWRGGVGARSPHYGSGYAGLVNPMAIRREQNVATWSLWGPSRRNIGQERRAY